VIDVLNSCSESASDTIIRPVTSNDEPSSRSSRPRRPRQSEASSSSTSGQRADQGDLWADGEEASPGEEASATDGIDNFVSDLPPPEEERAPPRAAIPRRAAAPPPVYEEYEDDEDYDEAEYSLLRNPYVLAALAVAGAIVLAVAFVIIFNQSDKNPSSGVVVTPPSPTPLPGQLPGVQAEGLAKAAIREGPGLEFFELGLLNKDQKVSVVGRDEDSTWYQIIFAGTDLKGWVPRSALKLPDNADPLIEVVVFTPIPKPSVEQPTATPEVTPTPEVVTPPDISLEVLGNVCPTSGVLNVALRNIGEVDIEGREIIITISTADEVLSEQTLELTLGVGQIVPINTGLPVQPPRTMVAVVFADAPQDVDPSNNVVTCVVSGSDNN
jgi:Bacterial SH3 domain